MNKLDKVKKKLEELEYEIETWQPPTLWEKANCRMLRRMKVQRRAYEKAIDRIEERARHDQARKEVSRDSSCGDERGSQGLAPWYYNI